MQSGLSFLSLLNISFSLSRRWVIPPDVLNSDVTVRTVPSGGLLLLVQISACICCDAVFGEKLKLITVSVLPSLPLNLMPKEGETTGPAE